MMRKYLFLIALLANSVACATIQKALESGQSPTPFVPENTALPGLTEAPQTPFTRKEVSGIYCSSDVLEAVEAYNKGVSYETTGDTEAAKEAYLQALAFDPAYCDAMDNLALLFSHEGAFDEAITWYQRSIKVFPENDVAHLGLANAYMELDELDLALEEYNQLLVIDPNNPEGYYGAGRVYYARENYPQAIDQFKKAEELYKAEGSPYIVDAQTFIGISYALIAEYENGRDYLEQVYPQMQDSPLVNYFLGYCYYYGASIRDDALAKKYFLRARELGVELMPELENFVNTP